MIRILVKCTEINRSNKSDRSDTMPGGGVLCLGMEMIWRDRPKTLWSDNRLLRKLERAEPASHRKNALETRSWSHCDCHVLVFCRSCKTPQIPLTAECWRARCTRSMKRCASSYLLW